MINYVEDGSKDIRFILRPEFPKLTETQKSNIEAHWTQASAKNPSMFNGQIYCANSVEERGNEITIGVNQSDYSTYKWARDNNHKIPGAYTMGNCILVYDPQRQGYVFLMRSDDVAFDKGKVSGIGGVLDYRNMGMNGFIDYVEKETLKEINEEVILQGRLHAVAFLGLYYDTETLKVEFVYYGQGHVLDVKAKESKALKVVPENELVAFVRNNQSRIEASTLVHLSHWAPKLAQK